jgi:hypothetical protein
MTDEQAIAFADALERISVLDAELRSGAEPELFTLLTAPSTSLYRSATDLSRFELELRRTAASIEAGGESDVNRPATLSAGRLEVVDAAAGSLEVLVVGIGVVQQVLLSDPMKAILTAATAAGHVQKVVAWVRRKLKPDDPLSKLTLRNAIDTLNGLEEIDRLRGRLGEPSIDITVNPPGEGGARAKGPGAGLRRITQVRRSADGSITLIVIEEPA